jgi:drug/metabolite transporter (DMT)-like permease
MAKSLSGIGFKDGIVIGTLFCSAGAFIILVSLGLVFKDSGNPPVWVGLLSGLCFLMPGLFALYYGFRNLRGPRPPSDFEPGEWILGVVVLAALSAIGGYITFLGADDRFSGGVTGTAIEMRIAFGIGTLICVAMTLASLVSGIRKWKKRVNSEQQTVDS